MLSISDESKCIYDFYSVSPSICLKHSVRNVVFLIRISNDHREFWQLHLTAENMLIVLKHKTLHTKSIQCILPNHLEATKVKSFMKRTHVCIRIINDRGCVWLGSFNWCATQMPNATFEFPPINNVNIYISIHNVHFG